MQACSIAQQKGQAMVEGLVALVPLSLLLLVIPLVGKWQDIGLRTQHASRYAAFDAAQQARSPAELASEVEQRFFATRRNAPSAAISNPPSGALTAPALWVDARNRSLLSTDAQRVSVEMQVKPSAESLGSPAALNLMRALQVPTESILTSRVILQGQVAAPSGFEHWSALRFERQVALLRFDGAATSDNNVQVRLDNDAAYPGSRSRQIAEPLVREMKVIDHGWGWQPGARWLEPWTGLVPADRLQATRPAP